MLAVRFDNLNQRPTQTTIQSTSLSTHKSASSIELPSECSQKKGHLSITQVKCLLHAQNINLENKKRSRFSVGPRWTKSISEYKKGQLNLQPQTQSFFRT